MPAPKKLAALVQQAAQKLEQLDYGSAMGLYRQALAVAPNNAGANFGLALVLNRVGKPAEALALLGRMWPAAQKATGPEGKRFQAAVLAQTGIAQEAQGQLQQALASFTRAQQAQPSTELAQRIAYLQPVVHSPEPVQPLLLHARHLQASGQYEQAIKTYSAVLQIHADNVDALRGLAALHQRAGALAQALVMLQKAAILAPQRPDLFNDLGLLFQARGDLLKAVSFHKRALKIDPHFVSAYVNMGVAYKRMGKNQDAIHAYRAALAMQPRSPEAHNNLGNLLRITGDLASAKQHLETAVQLVPGYADAQANLKAVLKALGAGTKAPANAISPKRTATKRAVAKKSPTKKAIAKKVSAKTPPAKTFKATTPPAKKAPSAAANRRKVAVR